MCINRPLLWVSCDYCKSPIQGRACNIVPPIFQAKYLALSNLSHLFGHLILTFTPEIQFAQDIYIFLCLLQIYYCLWRGPSQGVSEGKWWGWWCCCFWFM